MSETVAFEKVWDIWKLALHAFWPKSGFPRYIEKRQTALYSPEHMHPDTFQNP
jgi:hypothetical protein